MVTTRQRCFGAQYKISLRSQHKEHIDNTVAALYVRRLPPAHN
jgi:hypothetical protein